MESMADLSDLSLSMESMTDLSDLTVLDMGSPFLVWGQLLSRWCEMDKFAHTKKKRLNGKQAQEGGNDFKFKSFTTN